MKIPQPGHRVMVKKGFYENDTMAFVGQRGTVLAVYRAVNREMVVSVKLDSRGSYDSPMVFGLRQLANSNPGKSNDLSRRTKAMMK